MRKNIFSVIGPLVMFENMLAPWTYIAIPLDKIPDVPKGGWKSVKIEVKLGESVWRTSMFPLDKEAYFIPIKKAVLKAENLKIGQKVKIEYSPV